ncbi:UNVERIFIED_ORG: beta-galactosidase-like protein [Martelella mediterranea]
MQDKNTRHIASSHFKDWWKRPYRMVQTNLRMPDAQYDQRLLAREVREMGADVLLYNMGGIYAFYPTALPLQAENPMMAGDALGAAVEAAHAEGLSLVGRLDLSKATRKAYEAHPDWFVHNVRGQALSYNGTYQACVNGGWYQDHALDIISELLRGYDIDGIFFNMFGYMNHTYSGDYFGICVCDNCRARFRAFSGRELPEREDFSDPAYADYLKFQDRSAMDLSARIYDHIKQLKPEIGVTGGRGKSDLIRLEIQRFIFREPPEWPYQPGEQARWARAFGQGKNASSTSTNFVDYPWRFAAETPDCHILRFAQQLASGASLDYYLLGTPDQADQKAFGPITELFEWHRKHEGCYSGLRSRARVAMYHSRKTGKFRARTRTADLKGHPFRGAYRALIEDRIPFDFVCDETAADDGNPGPLEGYDVLLVSNAACLSDDEARRLDDWVAAGGTLIATGETGFYDEEGRPRALQALSSLPVRQLNLVRPDMRGAYFRNEGGEAGLPDAGLIMLDGYYLHCEPAEDAERVLALLPPQRFGPPELCYPDVDSDLPGILSRRHGQGRAIYLPWFPDWQYYRDSLPDMRRLVTGLIGDAVARPVVVRGAGAVEVTLQKQPETGRLLVHLVNYSGQRNNLYEKPAELHGLLLGVRGAAGDAKALREGSVLQPLSPQADEDGYLWYRLGPVGAFEAVSIASQS